MNIVTVHITDKGDFDQTIERHAFYGEDTAMYRLIEQSARVWAKKRCAELDQTGMTSRYHIVCFTDDPNDGATTGEPTYKATAF